MDKNAYSTILNNIRKIQKDRDLKASTMASLMCVSDSHFSKIMSGQNTLSIPQLDNLATGLKLSIVDILTYPEKFVPAKNNGITLDTVLQIRLTGVEREKVMSCLLECSGDDVIKRLLSEKK